MYRKGVFFIPLTIVVLVGSCQNTMENVKQNTNEEVNAVPTVYEEKDLDTAYFASGCFWCVEAIYESIKGVQEAVSGYSGGKEKNPTYQSVGTHAETVQVIYNPSIVRFNQLLNAYYGSQDPTTFGQEPDFGEHYRSIIFYQNQQEKMLIDHYKDSLNSSGKYSKPVITEVKEFDKFWKAEDYHQNYERLHPDQPYVRSVSRPRLERFKQAFPELLK